MLTNTPFFEWGFQQTCMSQRNYVEVFTNSGCPKWCYTIPSHLFDANLLTIPFISVKYLKSPTWSFSSILTSHTDSESLACCYTVGSLIIFSDIFLCKYSALDFSQQQTSPLNAFPKTYWWVHMNAQLVYDGAYSC